MSFFLRIFKVKNPGLQNPALICPHRGFRGLSPLHESAGVMECWSVANVKFQAPNLRVLGVPPEADQVSGVRIDGSET